VANLSLATSENWKDKNTGERKDKTEWHRVSVTNEGLIKVIENYVHKGSKLYIEGQLETRKWQDQNGQDKYSTEVVLRPYRGELTMLDSRNQGQSQGGGFQDNQSGGFDQGAPAQAASQSQAAPASAPEFEDEIPF